MGTDQGIYPWVGTVVMGNLMGRLFWVGRGCFFLGGRGGKRKSQGTVSRVGHWTTRAFKPAQRLADPCLAMQLVFVLGLADLIEALLPRRAHAVKLAGAFVSAYSIRQPTVYVSLAARSCQYLYFCTSKASKLGI
jgi:hypothetical protein